MCADLSVRFIIEAHCMRSEHARTCDIHAIVYTIERMEMPTDGKKITHTLTDNYARCMGCRSDMAIVAGKYASAGDGNLRPGEYTAGRNSARIIVHSAYHWIGLHPILHPDAICNTLRRTRLEYMCGAVRNN